MFHTGNLLPTQGKCWRLQFRGDLLRFVRDVLLMGIVGGGIGCFHVKQGKNWRSVHTYQILARLLLCLIGHIKRTIKQANWIETHSAHLTVCFHLHNVIQKRYVVQKSGKCEKTLRFQGKCREFDLHQCGNPELTSGRIIWRWYVALWCGSKTKLLKWSFSENVCSFS